jgi:hypothetical protein
MSAPVAGVLTCGNSASVCRENGIRLTSELGA